MVEPTCSVPLVALAHTKAEDECNAHVVVHVLKYLHESDWFPNDRLSADTSSTASSPQDTDKEHEEGFLDGATSPYLLESSVLGQDFSTSLLTHPVCAAMQVQLPFPSASAPGTWQRCTATAKPHNLRPGGMHASEKLAPVAATKRPMLLWCTANTQDQAIMQTLGRDFRHQRYLHFQTSVKFTRWLFEQQRGRLQPWSVLVVGWREAKPSMSALLAARSGDTSLLRPDDRRPPLRSPTGGQCVVKPARIAVSHMVVTLESPSQQARALAWVKSTQTFMPELNMSVVCGNTDLKKVLTAILNEQGFCRETPHFAPKELRTSMPVPEAPPPGSV